MAVQNGESPEIVARVLRISRATIYNWVALYRDGGWGKQDVRKRGGREPKLEGKKLKWIYEIVTEKNSMQLKFSFALWTSKMISELIRKKYGIRLSKVSVCRLLNQLGFDSAKAIMEGISTGCQDGREVVRGGVSGDQGEGKGRRVGDYGLQTKLA